MTETRTLGRVLGLIPAKGTSQRLTSKNLRSVAGKSLLYRAIDSAKLSGVIDRIFVSTEDPVIADEARALGLDIPFMRPKYLSRDPYGVVDVAIHALDAWQDKGEHFDTLIILLPTSPLRSPLDIRYAAETYLEKAVDFLHSVSREEHSPLQSLIIKDGLLTPLHPEWMHKMGSQKTAETPELVRANGAVSIVNVNRFRIEKNYYCYPLAAYEMPWNRSVDIDTEMDLLWAQFLEQQFLVGDGKINCQS